MLRSALCFFICACTQLWAADGTLAQQILDTTSRTQGLCGVLSNDSLLGVTLAEKSGYLVYIRSQKSTQMEVGTKEAHTRGLLGRRCYFSYGDVKQVPFADHSLDLLVVDASFALTETECLRALSPYGRLVWIEDGQVKKQSEKPFPEEMDNWEHWFHGPDNNSVSSDSVLKWPYLSQHMTLPFVGPVPSVMLVSHGRSFNITGPGIKNGAYRGSVETEEYSDVVIARSVFNGQELWRYDLPEGYYTVRSCAVATKDILYLSESDKVTCLDTETGAVVRTIRFGHTDMDVKWVALRGGIVYAMLGKKDPLAKIITYRYTQGHTGNGKNIWGFGTVLTAYDLTKESVLWSHESTSEIDSRSMGIAGDKWTYYAPESKIASIHLSDGSLAWEVTDQKLLKSIIRPVWKKDYGNNVLRTKAVDMLCTEKAIYLEPIFATHYYAFDANSGDVLWSLPDKKSRNTWKLLLNGEIYSGGKRYDSVTGKSTGKGIAGSGCGPITASVHGFYDRHGLNTDRLSGQKIRDHSFRSSCYQNSYAANGMQINPRYQCGCSYSLRGNVVLSSAGSFDFNQKATDEDRLESFTTPADNLQADECDWPVYKGNVSHSSVSKVTIDGAYKLKWETAANVALPTPAIAVQDFVYYGDEDGLIYALHNGKAVWNYATGGKIHSTPTFSNGRVYVGSSDGFVYCLTAQSGHLLWRFRAAPQERNIMVYGKLSSTWPVNTGVLIHDNVAYFAAGIVDRDGTHVFALDAETGKVRWHNNSAGFVDEANRKGVSAQGALTVQNGFLYMAGGNAISPACFNMTTGALIVSGYQSYSAYAPIRRGREMTAFGDTFLMGGGMLLYAPEYESDQTKISKGLSVSMIRLGEDGIVQYPEIEITSSVSIPVWDNEVFILESRGKKGGQTAYRTKEVVETVSRIIDENRIIDWPKKNKPMNFLGPKKLKKLKLKSYLPKEVLWKKKGFVLGMSLTANAYIYLSRMQNKELVKSYALTAINKTDGTELWSIPLTEKPLSASICVNRHGDVIISMVDGKIQCYGAIE